MGTNTLPAAAGLRPSGGIASRDHRKDIQGLRALAVGIVLLYHLWPNRFTGGFIGVDVFFVISGFLITSHLLKTPPKNWKDVVAFWGRRIRRLLPASLLVLFVAGIATYLFAPQSVWADTGRQILSAAFYVVNWDFASSSVDYLAADNAPSPVQHFWSLSVEEQFYFIWPLVVGLACYAGARFKRSNTAVAVAVASVFVLSLVFSLYYTAMEPAMAYFVTPTRMWELAAGGLVAVVMSCVRPQKLPLRSLMSWLGLVGVVAGTFLIRPDMPFPGYLALVPVVSTALVILAATESRRSPYVLLSLRPAQFLGDISYSVYLWHWPMIVLVPYFSEQIGFSANLGRLDKTLIIVASLAVAWISTEFVENRFRRQALRGKEWKTFGFAAVAMIVVGILGLSQMWVATRIVEKNQDEIQAELSDPKSCLGGNSLPSGSPGATKCPDRQPLKMAPAAAKNDKSRAYADGCWARPPYSNRPECTYGRGEKKIALVGNSHAGHWLPALEVLAERNDWTITTFLASTCSISTLPQDLSNEETVKGCQDYGRWVTERTTSGEFDAVITSERQSTPLQEMSWAETEKNASDGHTRTLEEWNKAELDVVVIRDTPYPGAEDVHVPDCVASHEDRLEECAGTPTSWYWMDPLAEEARSMDLPSTKVVYPEDWFCPEGRCEPVIGGVITYFDTAHITATYARTLAPQLDSQLRQTGLATFDRSE